MKETIRILLADDHMIVRESLAKILRNEYSMNIVGEASDGQMAVELAHQLIPDVVIMDLSMPRLSGIEATRIIVSHHPGIKVIGFTMHSQSNLGNAMQTAGASACICKSDPIEVLVSTIRNCCCENSAILQE
jgi:DNA-binding NarL/FixJ family response regulator